MALERDRGRQPSGGKGAGTDNQVHPPGIVLPKGGGAIRGVGEKFAANPVTGTGGMNVPIATSPGRSGFGPQLSLSYDSGAGNGPFGFGWSLSLPAVTRKTDKGLPQYQDAVESDVYVLSGSEDLVPVLQPDGKRFKDDKTVPGYIIHRYRPRIEGLFARIERWTKIDNGEIHWRSISRDNVATLYGKDSNSRVFDPADPDPNHPTRIFSWLMCESYDDKGNAIVYEYAPENDENVDRGHANELNRARTANRYLKCIKYGNRKPNRDPTTWEPTDPTQLPKDTWMFEVVFDYDEAHCEDVDLDPSLPKAEQHRFARVSASVGQSWTARPDPFSSYRAGFEVRTYRRCRRVLMFHHIPELATGEKGYEGLVRSTEFDYADLDDGKPVAIEDELAHQGSTRFASFIRAVTQSGYVRDETQPVVVRNGVEYATYLKKSLPPLEFEYSKATIQEQVYAIDSASLENLPAGIDGSSYQWVDLDGEGVSGILTEQAGAWFYKPNLGEGHFGPVQTVGAVPSLADLSGGRQQLLDLAGDGQLDLVAFSGPSPGFYERTFDENWTPFRVFRQLPEIAWGDPNLRFVDLNGDGHADVLITEQDVFTWHPSLAEEGFGAARVVHQELDDERGPRVVFADGTQSIYLADMCGDGLADLVRIRNGEVCYWPNLGYGRFGTKVTMDNAPWFDHPDQFDERRIRLADIDGSGTSDIIYLARDSACLYFNQSGNRLSEVRRLAQFPVVDNVSSVMTADLLGNGTACLVWSSPLPANARRTVRYIDLMGGTKPHLLIRSANNLGAETEVHYAASTGFYLEDKRNGRPWVTRLPFPVHVVDRVVTHDRISGNQFVTSYAYHHGYFDGIEREFRGFGLVEQKDTEQFGVLNPGGEAPVATNIDEASHVPPVLTKTWFHTGVYDETDEVSRHFAAEYYGAPEKSDPNYNAHTDAFLKTLLPDTVLPSGLAVDEEREACRALKGSMLRQEVYALDGTGKGKHPYTVTEQNFTIRMVQPRKQNRHAAFFTHARESISCHYEREPADPRVAHALTLEVDEYGNVLRSVDIGYGRHQPDASLSQADQAKQAQTLVTYTENSVTHDIESADDYRSPLPCESRTYELTGLTLPPGSDRFCFDGVLNNAAAAIVREYEYEVNPALELLEKRVIEHVRTLYRPDDLGVAQNDPLALLPLRTVQPLALAGESYKLAFTADLAREVFVDSGKLSQADLDLALATGGRYVHSEGDANWWIPSGRIFYSPNRADTAALELANARQHFFLPHRYRDPFHTNALGTESFVTYDRYDLLVHETCDALGNQVTVGERPRVLANGTLLPEKRRNDYRVLQAALVMDLNRNCTEVAFDALGMVSITAVMGKPEEMNQRPGDALENQFQRDLTRAQIDAFIAKPRKASADPEESEATQIVHDLLGNATKRIVYDLDRYKRLGEPAFAATIARETHVSDLQPTQKSKLQISLSYSDGFGREIQKKIQAEPGPVPMRDVGGKVIVGADGQPQMTPDDFSPRWVGSGWTVFNNKGKPVRQYEPFFTDAHRFEFEARIGVSPVLFYDPVERVIATLHANHTWEKVVFDAWRQEAWDVNDTLLIADPKTDADVGRFFSRLPDADYLPTWHALRTDPANAVDFSARYPDPTGRANEMGAAKRAQAHAATPAVAHADSLGRTFLTVAHNKFKYSNAPPAAPPIEEFHSARVIFDIEGNQRTVRDAVTKTVDAQGNETVDALGRIVMRYDYDMLGNRVHQASMEAGERWMLNDVAGKPLYAWDSRNHQFRIAYDELRRPTDSLLREGTSAEIVVGSNIYGESRPNPEASNLRGKVVEVRDQAGVVTSDLYDFKGNLLQSRRQLADLVGPKGSQTPAYRSTVDWNGSVQPGVETYTSRTRYDALNRPIQLVAPHCDQPGTTFSIIQPSYNEANLLEQVHAWLNQNAEPDGGLDPATANLHAVTDVDYDAKGQRSLISYGNGVKTKYTHDPLTFRLVHLLTWRRPGDFPDDCPEPPPDGWPGCQVQNLHYTYDPAGNITYIRDDAQQTIYFKNKRVEPSADYVYDALYRLIEATGREHLGQVGGLPIPNSYNDFPRVGIWTPGPGNGFHPHDGNAMDTYCESYIYDSASNITEIVHRVSCPGAVSWRRAFNHNEPSALEAAKQSNRLTSTVIAGTTETYSTAGDGYDAHGNMLRMPHLQTMQWDFKDQLRMTRRQAVNPADEDGVKHEGERTWYVYDSTGQRVRKVTELNGEIKNERLYLGVFEIYRKNGINDLVRETLHIMDDRQRIALVETRTDSEEPRIIRYQFGNHLGSASLELDGEAQIISYEEYTPYGSTSYQSVRSQNESPKFYCYSAKERDEESGLYYHVTRYYLPWLGRWMSPDPLGIVDTRNSYEYARSSPTRWNDPHGTQAKQSSLQEIPQAETALADLQKWSDKNVNRIAWPLPKGWQFIGPQEYIKGSSEVCWGIGSSCERVQKLAFVLNWTQVGPIVDFGGPLEGKTGLVPALRVVTTGRGTWVEAAAKITYSEEKGFQPQWEKVGEYYRGQGMWVGASGTVVSPRLDPIDFVAGSVATKLLSRSFLRAVPKLLPAADTAGETGARIAASGVPADIALSGARLSPRQARLLAQLESSSTGELILPRSAVNTRDLAALTAQTGREYAMFTTGGRRLIVMGSERGVPVDVSRASELFSKGWRFSGHTHPGMVRQILLESGGDRAVLQAFKTQQQSVIYNSLGQWRVFGRDWSTWLPGR